ncbi:MAG: DUF1573 domain-containing protein [Deltaproteobacteria bacterium]|nr:DUF1573 domain-containing protein [Deltaproteobacteria bacterium]
MASAKEILPGGEGKIDIKFKSGDKAGKREKTITVSTNDPDNKAVKLKVSTVVEVVLSTKPSRLNFGRLSKKDLPVVKHVALTGTAKDSIKLSSVKSQNDKIKVETSPTGYENNKDKRIQVSVLPGLKVGRFRDRVTIVTDHPKVKNVTLYVYGEVMGSVAVKPTYLSFGVMKKDKTLEKSITLTATGETSFKVLNVTASVAELKTRVETVKEGKEYRVTATVPQDFAGQILKGSIKITTDDKEQETIEVKFFGRKAGKPVPEKAINKDAPQKKAVPPKKD